MKIEWYQLSMWQYLCLAFLCRFVYIALLKYVRVSPPPVHKWKYFEYRVNKMSKPAIWCKVSGKIFVITKPRSASHCSYSRIMCISAIRYVPFDCWSSCLNSKALISILFLAHWLAGIETWHRSFVCVFVFGQSSVSGSQCLRRVSGKGVDLLLRLLTPSTPFPLGVGKNMLLIFILPDPLLLQIELQGSVTGALSTGKYSWDTKGEILSTVKSLRKFLLPSGVPAFIHLVLLAEKDSQPGFASETVHMLKSVYFPSSHMHYLTSAKPG